MATMDVSVLLRLVDELSGPAKKSAAALREMVAQVKQRKVDGWQTLATNPIDQSIDLAA